MKNAIPPPLLRWCIGKIHTVVDAIRRYSTTTASSGRHPIFTTIAGEGEQTLFGWTTSTQPSSRRPAAISNRAMALEGVLLRPDLPGGKSKTAPHQFWMVEPEIAYIDLPGLSIAKLVSYIVERVLATTVRSRELNADIAALERIRPPFYRLTYTEVVEILTSDRTAQFMTDQQTQFEARKAEIDRRIAEIEAADKKGGLKKWQQEKNVREMIELRSELAELEVKIENNPKHAQLAADFRWGKTWAAPTKPSFRSCTTNPFS